MPSEKRVNLVLTVLLVLVAGTFTYFAVFTHRLDAVMTPPGRCDSATMASAPSSDSAEIRRLCGQGRR